MKKKNRPSPLPPRPVKNEYKKVMISNQMAKQDWSNAKLKAGHLWHAVGSTFLKFVREMVFGRLKKKTLHKL